MPPHQPYPPDAMQKPHDDSVCPLYLNTITRTQAAVSQNGRGFLRWLGCCVHADQQRYTADKGLFLAALAQVGSTQ